MRRLGESGEKRPSTRPLPKWEGVPETKVNALRELQSADGRSCAEGGCWRSINESTILFVLTWAESDMVEGKHKAI